MSPFVFAAVLSTLALSANAGIVAGPAPLAYAAAPASPFAYAAAPAAYAAAPFYARYAAAPAPLVAAAAPAPIVKPVVARQFAAAPAPLLAPRAFAAPVAAPVAAAPAPLVAAAAPAPLAVASDIVDPYPQYSYAYNVQDTLTGDSKTQEETRDGDIVRGSYSLIEPDGSRRIVNYYADSINGFNAVVQKDVPVAAVAPVVAAKSVAAPLVAAPAPVVAKSFAAPIVV
ncbi:PREDICTED: larval cuticle protein A3A [Rhagoletis zephyria]|uniref:larval cuticle protein A3A n=1 Tax=Rhagoletis zephyria TaxID=28612 RepID=UPI000811A4F2|nr:PREDICTED: larval cuticle protein A3A [Rhagoletis zephyria]